MDNKSFLKIKKENVSAYNIAYCIALHCAGCNIFNIVNVAFEMIKQKWSEKGVMFYSCNYRKTPVNNNSNNNFSFYLIKNNHHHQQIQGKIYTYKNLKISMF